MAIEFGIQRTYMAQEAEFDWWVDLKDPNKTPPLDGSLKCYFKLSSGENHFGMAWCDCENGVPTSNPFGKDAKFVAYEISVEAPSD